MLLTRIKEFIETPELVLGRAFLFAGIHNGQPQQVVLDTLWRDLQKDLTLLAGALVGAVVIEPDEESDVMSFRASPLRMGLAVDESELRQWMWGSAHVPWLGVASVPAMQLETARQTNALLGDQAAALQTLQPALTAEESQHAMKVDWRLVHAEVQDAPGLPDEATKLKWLYWFKNGDARQPDGLVVHYGGRQLTPQNIVWDGLPVPSGPAPHTPHGHVLDELELVANEMESSGNGDITPAAVGLVPWRTVLIYADEARSRSLMATDRYRALLRLQAGVVPPYSFWHDGRRLTSPTEIDWDGFDVGACVTITTECAGDDVGTCVTITKAAVPRALVPRSQVEVLCRHTRTRVPEAVAAFALNRLQLNIGEPLKEYCYLDPRDATIELTRASIDWTLLGVPDPVAEYRQALVDLHRLIQQGRNQSSAAAALRNRMEQLETRLSAPQLEQLNELSAQLQRAREATETLIPAEPASAGNVDSAPAAVGTQRLVPWPAVVVYADKNCHTIAVARDERVMALRWLRDHKPLAPYSFWRAGRRLTRPSEIDWSGFADAIGPAPRVELDGLPTSMVWTDGPISRDELLHRRSLFAQMVGRPPATMGVTANLWADWQRWGVEGTLAEAVAAGREICGLQVRVSQAAFWLA